MSACGVFGEIWRRRDGNDARRNDMFLAEDGAAEASEATAAGRDPNSIAVLPFVNMSNDADQEYFVRELNAACRSGG